MYTFPSLSASSSYFHHYAKNKGSVRINQTQHNDLALPYPQRVSVEVKWTEALTSK